MTTQHMTPVVAHPSRRVAWLAAWVLALLVPPAATAQTPRSSVYLSSVSTTAYRSISSPVAPQSAEECQALDRELGVQTRTLSTAHDQCLHDTPAEDHGSGTCSKASCQALHTAKDEAGKWRDSEMSTCRSRLSAILAMRRRDEEQREKRRQAEAAEERRRELDRARAEDKAKAEAATQAGKEKLQQQARAKAEADAAERRQRDERDRDLREAAAMVAAEQAKTQREQQMKDSWARLDDTRGNSAQRTSLLLQEAQRLRRERQALVDAAAAEQAARAAAEASLKAAERSAAAKRDVAAYGELMSRLSLGADVTWALGSNKPIRSVVTQIGAKVDEYALNAGLDKTLALGPEATDRIYERGVLSASLLGKPDLPTANPFSSAFSGLAMSGITHLQRQTLGQLGGAMEQVETLVQETSSPSSSSHTGSSQGTQPAKLNASGNDNPFLTKTPSAAEPTDPAAAAAPASGPDEVMVRQAGTGTVTVIPLSAWRDYAVGDLPNLGEHGCTVTGIGRITPECEKLRRQRKANPFR